MVPGVLPDYNLENKDHPYHHIWRKWNPNHSEDPEKELAEDTSEKEEENTKNKEEELKIRVSK